MSYLRQEHDEEDKRGRGEQTKGHGRLRGSGTEVGHHDPRHPHGDAEAGSHADEDTLAVVGDDAVGPHGRDRADDHEEHDVDERLHLHVRSEFRLAHPLVGAVNTVRLGRDKDGPLNVQDNLRQTI